MSTEHSSEESQKQTGNDCFAKSSVYQDYSKTLETLSGLSPYDNYLTTLDAVQYLERQAEIARFVAQELRKMACVARYNHEAVYFRES